MLAEPHWVKAADTTVLVVEDDDGIRELLSNFFEAIDLPHLEAPNADVALALFDANPGIGVVLTDVVMPGRNGLDMLRIMQDRPGRDAEYIVMTGYGGEAAAINALRLGAVDFLQKPVNLRHLERVIDQAFERLIQRRALLAQRQTLEAEVEANRMEIRSLEHGLAAAYVQALECLAVASEYRDQVTGSHIRRIGAYSKLVADGLGMSREDQYHIELAAPLHDVGKIGVPDAILLKSGKLTDEEYAVMKQHAAVGHRILAVSDHPVMRIAANIALAHHERHDGSGYPRRLAGTEIPVEARIVQLCDVYDALRAARPYKPGLSHEHTCGIIIEGDGRTQPAHFEPHVLAIFRERHRDFERIFTEN